KSDRRGVAGIDAGDHHVLSQGDRAGEEPFHQRATDSLTTGIRSDVDAVLDGVAVSGPSAGIAEAGLPEHPPPTDRDQDRVALANPRPEPDRALLEGGGLVAEDRRRGDQYVVVDGEDSREVRLVGVANVHGKWRLPGTPEARPVQLARHHLD